MKINILIISNLREFLEFFLRSYIRITRIQVLKIRIQYKIIQLCFYY